MGGRSAAALAVVLLLTVGALTNPTGPALGRAANSVHIGTTDSIVVNAVANYGYSPDTFQQVPINATITVSFTDDDPSGMQHSFNISSREGWVIPTTYTAAQLNHLFGIYPTLYSAIVNFTGDQSVGTFHSPTTPGWYEFVCNVSGHFQLGMYGFIAFGENLPSNLTRNLSVQVGGGNLTGLAVAFGVLFVAVVLGILVWRRGRTLRRTPPEPAGRAKTGSTGTREAEDGRKRGPG
jgi:plastocyanin